MIYAKSLSESGFQWVDSLGYIKITTINRPKSVIKNQVGPFAHVKVDNSGRLAL